MSWSDQYRANERLQHEDDLLKQRHERFSTISTDEAPLSFVPAFETPEQWKLRQDAFEASGEAVKHRKLTRDVRQF